MNMVWYRIIMNMVAVYGSKLCCVTSSTHVCVYMGELTV